MTSATEHGQATIDRLTKRGVLRLVYRRHGRMYHPLTNLAKPDRRRMLIDGKPVAEVDMHAAYTAILASMLSEPDRRSVVAKLRDRTWYQQFEQPYAEFALAKRAEMEATGCSAKAIEERLCGAKVEYQRQCLFWSDSRQASRPLFAVLRHNHPAMADLILHLRQLYGARGLATLLMQAEGRLFVDTAIPQLHQAGILALGIHDGLVVRVDDTKQTKQTAERVSLRQLGYVPGISIK